MNAIDYYNTHAPTLAEQYYTVSTDDIHSDLMGKLRLTEGLDILDVGAGTGRDAIAMQELGHNVTAVEPAEELWKYGSHWADRKGITHLNDRLPDLITVTGLYDYILLSAVWQHLSPAERPKAMDRILSLLKSGGSAYILLRLGVPDYDRGMHDVSAQEILDLTSEWDCDVFASPTSEDKLKRSTVEWQTVCITLL